MNYKSNVDIDIEAIKNTLKWLESVDDKQSIDEIMEIIEENIYYINREDLLENSDHLTNNELIIECNKALEFYEMLDQRVKERDEEE